jgi:choline dehydrogenase-like flavoprotein
MSLTDSERRVLSLACDAFVPSVHDEPVAPDFYLRSASQAGVDKVLAQIVERKLPPGLQSQFRRLLGIIDSRFYNLLLTGWPVKFGSLTQEERVGYLRRWRDSRIGSKRTAFQALKRFSCFLFYAVTDERGDNPNWSAIGYSRPDQPERASHPAGLRIIPLSPEQNPSIECDVCIIGSGAGGSVIAYELSKVGLRVLVVEEGDYLTSESFGQEEFSMSELKPRVFFDYATALSEDLSFIMLAGRGAGGGTVLNWSTSLKPPPFVLQEWEREFGIEGINGREFQSYLDEIWSVLKINKDESQSNLNNGVLWKGCLELGYKEGVDWEVISRNVVGCAQRCDSCTFGCVYACKQSTILNYLPMAFQQGTMFLFNTRAEYILIERGSATGVECSSSGRKVTVRAKVVVAACGALNTPALLLNSGVREKNIGKNLRLHPTTAVAASFDGYIDAWRGAPQTVEVSKFLNLDGTGHGFWLEAVPPYPGLFAMSLPWDDGRAHKAYMLNNFRKTAATIILLREWGSGEVKVDRHGFPKVSYRLDTRDKLNFVKGIKEAAKILAAAGAIEIVTLHSDYTGVKGNVRITKKDLDSFNETVTTRGIDYNKIMLYSAHLMGTCRISAEESTGAARPSGELYGVENLFIGDASVFPTDLGVNPMVTIMAMAKRTAGFILKKFGK